MSSPSVALNTPTRAPLTFSDTISEVNSGELGLSLVPFTVTEIVVLTGAEFPSVAYTVKTSVSLKPVSSASVASSARKS